MVKNTRMDQKLYIQYIIRSLIAGGCLLIFFCPVLAGSQESSPVDISGYWEAKKTPASPFILFHFTISHNRLLGTVRVSELGKSRIVDGSIQKDRVRFSTRHQVVKEHAQYNRTTGQWSRTIYEDIFFQYEGKIIKKGIRFIRQNKDGYFAELLALKVVDKTRQLSSNQNTYSLNYTLPGHEGGVNSLSFGPEDGRYGNGGLRLASGGARDGLVKRWNLATGKFSGDTNMKQGMPPDDAAVQVLYNPLVGDNKRVRLQAGAISSFRFLIYLSDMGFGQFSSGASGKSISLDGITGIMTFSSKKSQLAFSEIMDDGTTKLHVRYTSGNVIQTLKTSEQITALAFDRAEKFLAVAETSAGKDKILKLIDVKEGNELWKINTPVVLDALAFQPHGKGLAAGGKNKNIIYIYKSDDGTQTQSLPIKDGGGVSRLVFSHDGNFMAACSPGSKLITIWHAGDGFILEEVVEALDPVSVLALNHDGHLMVTGHKDNDTIKLWGKGKKQ